MSNAPKHLDISIVGAFDCDHERMNAFCNYYKLKPYESLEPILEDKSIELILNLTNPKSHYEISKACLCAAKHVYSEKPLAMKLEDAHELAQLADEHKVRLSCAPCSLLSDPAQSILKALKKNEIGTVRLVYANYDDGLMCPPKRHWEWKGPSGSVWPGRDEFEVGCTYEHAGYFLTWLAAFFGPARRVTAFASCQIPDKGIEVSSMAPDFSVGCIEYDNNVVARVTCGLLSPDEKAMLVMGDKGFLEVENLRNERDHIYLSRFPKQDIVSRGIYKLREKYKHICRKLPSRFFNQKYDKAFDVDDFLPAGRGKFVDFMRGPSEMVDAIKNNRPHRLSAELGIHIFEIIEVLQYPQKFDYSKKITTTFPEIEPLV
jgi:predicted dehydrogenase